MGGNRIGGGSKRGVLRGDTHPPWASSSGSRTGKSTILFMATAPEEVVRGNRGAIDEAEENTFPTGSDATDSLERSDGRDTVVEPCHQAPPQVEKNNLRGNARLERTHQQSSRRGGGTEHGEWLCRLLHTAEHDIAQDRNRAFRVSFDVRT